jgi:DNA polymerase elongation subunit (family B)
MTAQSAGAKALEYAEGTLKVHMVYHEALQKRNELDEILGELSELRDTKRDLDVRLVDAEMLVAAEEWAKHPDMSAARMEKHVKVAYSQNDDVRQLREQIIKLSGDIEGRQYDVTICEVDIKIAVARLQELGGYLNYLAAIKQAGIASEAIRALEKEAQA